MSSVASGFKQNNPTFLRVVNTIPVANFLTYTPGTGSGGAFLPGSFATFAYGATDVSTNLQVGNSVKDMGRTVISSGRVFRKVQVMKNTTAGLVGAIGGSVFDATPSFGTGYLEVAGDAGDTVNCLA
jgi:hypothetical protein